MQLSCQACPANTHDPSWAGSSGGPWAGGAGGEDNGAWVGGTGGEDNGAWAGGTGGEDNGAWAGGTGGEDNGAWVGGAGGEDNGAWAGSKGHERLRPWRRRGAGPPAAASQGRASPLSVSLSGDLSTWREVGVVVLCCLLSLWSMVRDGRGDL
jgi:hypothetical protein